MRIVLFAIAGAAYCLACWKGDVNTANLAWWAGLMWGYVAGLTKDMRAAAPSAAEREI